jgi:hypothetical protein
MKQLKDTFCPKVLQVLNLFRPGLNHLSSFFVIPAKPACRQAGRESRTELIWFWIPAFAGMTNLYLLSNLEENRTIDIRPQSTALLFFYFLLSIALMAVQEIVILRGFFVSRKVFKLHMIIGQPSRMPAGTGFPALNPSWVTVHLTTDPKGSMS